MVSGRVQEAYEQGADERAGGTEGGGGSREISSQEVCVCACVACVRVCVYARARASAADHVTILYDVIISYDAYISSVINTHC